MGFDDIQHKKIRRAAIITAGIVVSLVVIILFFKDFFADNYKMISSIAIIAIFIIYCIMQIIKSRNKQERQQKIDSPMKTPKGLLAIKTKYITDVIPYIIQVILVIAFFLLAFYFII